MNSRGHHCPKIKRTATIRNTGLTNRFLFKRLAMYQTKLPAILLLLSAAILCPLMSTPVLGQVEQTAGLTLQDPIALSSPTVTSANPLAPKAIRLHLWDGTVVGGELTFDKIDVVTQYGALQIPIANIVQFRPGLDSFPTIDARINQWVQQLGDRDFATRENAHRELSSMGLQLKLAINKFDDGGSAERKKHLTEIRQEIEQLLDEESMSNDDSLPLIRLDTIVTNDFTIVGKIQQESFPILTKHGALEVGIADIQKGDRTWLTQAPTARKTAEIKGNSFFQTNPTTTGIRVNRGDRISIRSDGTVSWSNWGSISSTPDGITNQGQWNGINCGKLIARIGKSGKNIEVGTKADFVANSSGVLYLGIAMQDNYANQKGYNWPGQYQAKLSVQPAKR